MKRRQLIGAILSGCLLVGLVFLWHSLRERHDRSEFLSGAHLLERLIWVYRQDHGGDFPEAINDLPNEDGRPIVEQIFPNGSGVSIQYTRPKTNDPDDEIVVILERGKHRVVCYKENGIKWIK